MLTNTYFKKYRLRLFLIVMFVIILCTREGLLREWRLAVERVYFGCSVVETSHRSCIMKFYNNLAHKQGVKSALADVAKSQGQYTSVRTLCHQITHAIGRAGAEGDTPLATLFAEGDPLCGSGYYHGVVEGKMRGIRITDITPTFINNFCADTALGQQHPFDYANCTHGVGHALMYISDNDIPIALLYCERLTDKQDRNNCAMGAFMENIIASGQGVDHDTRFVRENDMYFPCTIVIQSEFIPMCYVAQAAHIWKSAETPTLALRVCRDIPDPLLQDACTSGLGRVIADDAEYSQTMTIAGCRNATEDSQFRTCIMGAMEGFIVHYRDTAQALTLCHAVPIAIETTCSNERIAEFRAYIGG